MNSQHRRQAFKQLCWGFPSTKLIANVTTAASQYLCQRAAFVFVLEQGNKLMGSLHLKGATAGLVRAPRRNLKPCKSAIV